MTSFFDNSLEKATLLLLSFYRLDKVIPAHTGFRVWVTPSVADKEILDMIVQMGGGTGILELPLIKEVELTMKIGCS